MYYFFRFLLTIKARNLIGFIVLLLFSIQGITQNNYLNQGNNKLKAGEYNEAEELYQKAIDHCGEDLKGNHNLAVMAAQLGDTEKALHTLDKCIKKEQTASAIYNRAILHLNNKDYHKALDDLKVLSNLKEINTGKLEKSARRIKSNAKQKEAIILDKLADQYLTQGQYELAIESYNKAKALAKSDEYFLLKTAQVGLAQKNPFVSLESAKAINYTKIDEAARIEVDLIKAISLGRINRMKEGVEILENLLYHKKIQNSRINKLLSYYYLKLKKYNQAINVVRGHSFEDPNVYLVAGNAALYLKRFRQASEFFDQAKVLDPQNADADLGRALCFSNASQHDKAMLLIDKLAVDHPENYRVLNTKGVVYKDAGLHFKDRHNNAKSKGYLLTSAAAFLKAQKINQNLKSSFESNRALALFYLDEMAESKKLWLANNDISSQNNLAILYASQNDYSQAYHKLDSLSSMFYSKYRKRHQLLEYNSELARARKRLNNNYKFITNYYLTQEKPQLVIENPILFELNEESEKHNSEFILEYSDDNCSEKPRARRKKKKRKRFKFFKRKKKKYKGDCPTF